MDSQQQQRINEAAQQFTDALVAAYRATSDRAVATQEQGAQLTQEFVNRVVNNLRAQAEDTRQMTQHLADQQQRAQEATRELTRASTDTYMELLDSVFSFYQGGASRTQRRIEEAERREAEAQRRAEEAERREEEAQRRAQEAERRVGEAERSTEEAEKSGSEAESQGGGELPLADYDSLNVRQISERLNELNVEEIGRLRDYEANNKNRRTVLERMDARISAASEA